MKEDRFGGEEDLREMEDDELGAHGHGLEHGLANAINQPETGPEAKCASMNFLNIFNKQLPKLSFTSQIYSDGILHL